MAVFTSVAAAVGTAIGLTGTALTIFSSVTALTLAIGTSRLIARKAMKPPESGGGRVQLPPATENKLPVLYGSGFMSGPITDAMISDDNKTMWYVVALAEHTDSTPGSGYTYDLSNIYYDGKKVQFGANGVVTGLVNTNTSPEQVDTKVANKINIWLFTNGSDSGVNTGGQTAIQLLQDTDIPVSKRWTSTDVMTNAAFAIVRVKYDTTAGTTSLGALMCKMTNSITKPGDALKDYMLNTRYGCAIPLSRIDTDSLDELNNYSDEQISFLSETGTPSTQVRYRINGPLDTGNNCLDNLQILVDACDSWLQYSELTAKWKIVINRSIAIGETLDEAIDDLFVIDDFNLLGGISISPINLNDTYNQLEVSYPNKDIKDQTDFQLLELEDYQPGILSPNEAVNKLDFSFSVVNNPVQALYLGIRKLLQSREDLTISLRTDYSGIQLEAGDVVRVKHNVYGWDTFNDNRGKLFRIASIQEEKTVEGDLVVSISAFEYNDTIYEDFAIQNFVLQDNLGVSNPNIFDKPEKPTVDIVLDGTIAYIEATGIVPDTGLIRYLDFNYGFNDDSANHLYYKTVTNANGEPLVGNTAYTIDIVDVPEGNLFFSVTARNDQVGFRSDSTETSITWEGPAVTEFDPITGEGGVTGNNIQNDSLDIDKFVPGTTGIEQRLFGYNYTVSENVTSTLTLPVNVNTFGTLIALEDFETPKFIANQYSGGGGPYPFYTGDSAIADGYLVESTAPLQPVDSDLLAIFNGDLNWFVTDYEFVGTAALAGDALQIDFNGQVVSNANVTLQVASFVSLNISLELILIDTEVLYSYELIENTPIRLNIQNFYTGGSITGGGIVMRILGDANVSIISGGFQTSRARLE